MEKYRKTSKPTRKRRGDRWGLEEQSRGSQDGHNNSRCHWRIRCEPGPLHRANSWSFEECKALVNKFFKEKKKESKMLFSSSSQTAEIGYTGSAYSDSKPRAWVQPRWWQLLGRRPRATLLLRLPQGAVFCSLPTSSGPEVMPFDTFGL